MNSWSGRSESDYNARWFEHAARQLEAGKGCITAVTVLNSGSWLALLTQADKLAQLGQPETVSKLVLFWGFGALCGTIPWVCVYFNTLFSQGHDFNPSSRSSNIGIIVTIGAGVILIILSLILFTLCLLSVADLVKV